MIKSINGATFRKMIVAGASLLEQNKKYVDSLNVFPVPDGDTGTNMFLTMKSGARRRHRDEYVFNNEICRYRGWQMHQCKYR